MSLKSRIGLLRYNYWISHLVVIVFKPLHGLMTISSRWIERKVKTNGFKVAFGEVEIVFPKNIGVNINTGIYWKGVDGFEPLTSKSLIALFGHAEVFFDVGSNFGFYSVLAQKINPSISVFCFEPLINIYEDNLRFHQLNQATRQTTYHVALSDMAGSTKFYVPDVYSVASEITSGTVEKDFVYNRQFKQKEITIQTTTLDLFLRENEEKILGRKLMLKIDVEGHEASVLEGGLSFFARLRPVIIIEIDKKSSSISRLKKWFTDQNYRVYAITKTGYFALSPDLISAYKGGRDFLVVPGELCKAIDYFSHDQLPSLLK